MLTQNEARMAVRILKAKGLSYTQIADKLGVKTGSVYNWLGGWFDLGTDKLLIIQEIEKELEHRE